MVTVKELGTFLATLGPEWDNAVVQLVVQYDGEPTRGDLHTMRAELVHQSVVHPKPFKDNERSVAQSRVLELGDA